MLPRPHRTHRPSFPWPLRSFCRCKPSSWAACIWSDCASVFPATRSDATGANGLAFWGSESVWVLVWRVSECGVVGAPQMSPCVPCELQRGAGSVQHLLKPLGTPVWHGPIGFGANRRVGLRAFAELVVVLWGQRTIGSRGHFRERLRVVCGRECLAAATGITRLTRGGQHARSYRLEGTTRQV